MPGWGTTIAIFILKQLQEKHLSKNKDFYLEGMLFQQH